MSLERYQFVIAYAMAGSWHVWTPAGGCVRCQTEWLLRSPIKFCLSLVYNFYKCIHFIPSSLRSCQTHAFLSPCSLWSNFPLSKLGDDTRERERGAPSLDHIASSFDHCLLVLSNCKLFPLYAQCGPKRRRMLRSSNWLAILAWLITVAEQGPKLVSLERYCSFLTELKACWERRVPKIIKEVFHEEAESVVFAQKKATNRKRLWE